MVDKYGTNTNCTCGHYESDHYISNAGIFHECEEDGCDCRVYSRVEQELKTMNYSEHQKLKANRELHSDISEFCEWLESNGYEICRLRDTQTNLTAIQYDTVRPDKIISEFLGIDPKRLEAEKQQMITEMLSKS